jgi:hypothetical protein
MGEGREQMPSHSVGARKGEELKDDQGMESGRHEKGKSHAGRKAGGRTARDSTGINPKKRESITGTKTMPPG